VRKFGTISRLVSTPFKANRSLPEMRGNLEELKAQRSLKGQKAI
jgi:hypothetical protein